MPDSSHSITLHSVDGRGRIRLSIDPPLNYSSNRIDLTLDEKSPAFQALSQAWGKSFPQTGAAYVVCSPVILNYEGCSTI